MTTRRQFLRFIGAFTAGAILPIPAQARIAGNTCYIEGMSSRLFACAPLEQGTYTMTWQCEKGLFITGVKAFGGEEFVRIYCDDYKQMHNPILSSEPVAFIGSDSGFVQELSRTNLLLSSGMKDASL